MVKSATVPTVAGSLLDTEHDLVIMQKLMGHATPVNTSLYDEPGEESKRRSVHSLHLSYQRKHQDTD
jgi:hypothetical protein